MATVASLSSTIVALQADVAANTASNADTAAALSVAKKETDTFYILFAGCLVFLMQCGFATLEAGSVRDKNVRNVLLKNALDACIGAIVWYLFGYGIATSGNAFIGTTTANYALSGLDDTTTDYSAAGYDWISFFFSFTFAAAASTIVSGAVAERCQLGAYVFPSSRRRVTGRHDCPRTATLGLRSDRGVSAAARGRSLVAAVQHHRWPRGRRLLCYAASNGRRALDRPGRRMARTAAHRQYRRRRCCAARGAAWAGAGR